MRRLAAALSAMLALAIAVPAVAQDAPATLIADRVAVEGEDRLIAEGSVEVLFREARIKATRVSYDRMTDRLSIEGPITVTNGPDTILLADSAELAPDLSEGIMRSARLVLRQQLQLAAAELHREQGRFSRLESTVASVCQVCPENPVPLWQIRAKRVIHDELERQLYFDHARLEVVGVPVFYLPRLRLPDPTLKRASGFLVPEVRVNNRLGTGIKLPYFVALGDRADLTVTPYLSSNRTRTLELRYRQAFRHGWIELNATGSRDDLREGELRSSLFAEGYFLLPRGFELDFGIESSSDPAYLLDYDYSDKDRLESTLEITRVRRGEIITADLVHFNTLRASESNATQPTIVTDLSYRRRFVPPALGGTADLAFTLHGHRRSSGNATDGLGRDVGRASVDLDWRRGWTGPAGLKLAAQGALAIDHYAIGDDDSADSSYTRAAPFAAVEMRWPLARAGRGGASHVLEPVAQLVWSDADDSTIPNDDSVLVAFDEGNLYSLSRFAGADRRETGLRANLGVTWTRYDPAGWSLGLTAGRVLRQDDPGQFASGSGLDGTRSDWLTALHLDLSDGLSVINRAVFDDGFDLTHGELRLDWQGQRVELASSLIWMAANAAEDRPEDASEWVADAAYQLRRNWTATADWRYDFVEENTARAGLGLEYRNECVTVGLSLSRRFTSSTSVTPTTDFGLTVALNGFGAGRDGRAYRRSCAR
ncbi:LPS-assembly protein [Rhodovulum iodosum]|uniref:LPS-assembly protein LptD n=1 Tax=Rhodovulum iodosum TaxID=68291 RepID=A0ABV3XV40_9RHOB|nr:LPS assembly protein LptD [Rhodovulum robiginosum]